MQVLAEVLDDSEAHRRGLLAESDALLERVERLRLAERSQVPPELGSAIRDLNLKLGRLEVGPPRTVRAAQQLVFAVQQRLMAGNPRHPRPRAHPDRAAGVPSIARLPRGGAWKFLSLPGRGVLPEPAWRELVELTVGRAWDRWSYAQGRAVAAARGGRPREAARVLHRARAAWSNYWELCCEAERLLGRPLEPP